MSRRELQLDAIEISDGLTIADMKRIFCLEAPAIDTAARRLQAYATSTPGASNMLRLGDVLWSWDTRPRRQQNGALIGRVYSKRRGEATRDAGRYKIDAGGHVLQLPAELRNALPGGNTAAIDTEDQSQSGGSDAIE